MLAASIKLLDRQSTATAGSRAVQRESAVTHSSSKTMQLFSSPRKCGFWPGTTFLKRQPSDTFSHSNFHGSFWTIYNSLSSSLPTPTHHRRPENSIHTCFMQDCFPIRLLSFPGIQKTRFVFFSSIKDLLLLRIISQNKKIQGRKMVYNLNKVKPRQNSVIY